ncbi:MAG TPA: FAD-dependent oxidoreductase [Terriglobales bacterium]|nr:FAD-dependent oxidoreductase [Terriglobales bacterium]
MRAFIELVVDLDHADDVTHQRRLAAQRLGCSEAQLTALQLRKRSLDARRGRVVVRLQCEAYYDEPAPQEQLPRPNYQPVTGSRSVLIVGCGPAGMFAALRLIELGIRPVVLERGKDVQARRRDLATIQRLGEVNPDSNYCFGEGGAGTYSDGKLYTRATKRGRVDDVLRTLVAHGAPAEILVEAHPHIGSNRLPKVVAAMRQTILAAGGEVRFNCRVTDLIVDAAGRACGVVTAGGDELIGEAVIVATGHSARDVFELLQARGARLDSKPFAVGLRVEHPQPLIDRIQYHGNPDPRLPAASYRLATTVADRAVFSFCMCPGGFIVPAATASDEIVVNGMSLSRRDSPFANSGIVVAIEPDDLAAHAQHGAFAGIELQRQLESMAFVAGGGQQRAPAQRLSDFIAARASSSLPACSYHPGITAAPLHDLLPPLLAARLRQGLQRFAGSMRGFLTEDAVVVGVETRTSSPVRIRRDAGSLQHPDIAGLYPCGEGAGYAGGIVSAALDGIRVAEACAAAAPAGVSAAQLAGD